MGLVLIKLILSIDDGIQIVVQVKLTNVWNFKKLEIPRFKNDWIISKWYHLQDGRK